MKKIVIIGGGISGFVSAINAKDKNNEVIILEGGSNPLKKLLITGNGRCNYFNEKFDYTKYHSEDISLLKKIITPESKNQILNFFECIGIIPVIKDGYYYPYSNQAISVKNALLKEAMVKDIKIKTNSYVKDIKKENDKFLIYTNDDAIICDKLIISTGSRAYPKTGSDGFGYTLSKKLGHKINEVLPALTQLHGKGSYFKDLNGVRARGSATLLENNQVLKEEIGEIQFTNYGISGICIFNLSGLASKGLSKNKKINININFIYDLGIDTKDKFYKFLQEKSKILKDRTISDFLDSFLNYKLTNVILNKSKIDKNSLLNKLTKDEIFKVADNIINFNIEITRTNSFDNAQVCQGGISLSQINISSFESLLMPNLYFTGELLDVNGDCGGYNIAFAVLSGIKAGKEARK